MKITKIDPLKNLQLYGIYFPSTLYRSVVPTLPPISTAASPSRHTPSVTHRNRQPHFEQHSQNSLRAALLHTEDHEEWDSTKELIVKVTELSAELSRMKVVIGRLEAERTNQDVWLKERWVGSAVAKV